MLCILFSESSVSPRFLSFQPNNLQLGKRELLELEKRETIGKPLWNPNFFSEGCHFLKYVFYSDSNLGFTGEILQLNPTYKAPADYKPLLKEAKVPIPVSIVPTLVKLLLLLLSSLFFLVARPIGWHYSDGQI